HVIFFYARNVRGDPANFQRLRRRVGGQRPLKTKSGDRGSERWRRIALRHFAEESVFCQRCRFPENGEQGLVSIVFDWIRRWHLLCRVNAFERASRFVSRRICRIASHLLENGFCRTGISAA